MKHRRIFPVLTRPFRILMLCAGWLAQPSAGRAVDYEIVPCCGPCAAVNDRVNYNTGFLSLFTLLVKGEDDWLFRSDVELMTRFGPDDENLGRLKLLSKMLKERGSQLVLVYHPTRGLVHPSHVPASARYDYASASANYRRTLERFRAAGIIVPDLTPLLNEAVQEHEYFFRRDHHWTPYGAQRAARIVADEVRRHPMHASLEKRSFSTRRVGLLHRNGTLQIAWYRLCGDRFADQYVDQFTSDLAESPGAGKQNELLFGDALPSVALVGTSFSSQEFNFNFDGYLKEYLEADVLNEAMEGAGGYDSMTRYLMSEEFHAKPPQIIIWEIPSYHDLNKQMFFRQAHASIQQGCTGKPVELARTVRLHSGRNEILFNGGGELKSLRGGHYLLDMQFDNPATRYMNATVWYVNGRSERVKIEHAPWIENRGRFTVALRDDAEWRDFNFLSMDLTVEGTPAAASVTARLCKDTDRTRLAER